jgi:hypothetical protein
MVNKCRDFGRTEFMEAKARDQQALGEPEAEYRLFQPAEELSRRHEHYRRYPGIVNPQALVDVLKISSISSSDNRSASPKTIIAGRPDSSPAAPVFAKAVKRARRNRSTSRRPSSGSYRKPTTV